MSWCHLAFHCNRLGTPERLQEQVSQDGKYCASLIQFQDYSARQAGGSRWNVLLIGPMVLGRAFKPAKVFKKWRLKTLGIFFRISEALNLESLGIWRFRVDHWIVRTWHLFFLFLKYFLVRIRLKDKEQEKLWNCYFCLNGCLSFSLCFNLFFLFGMSPIRRYWQWRLVCLYGVWVGSSSRAL